MNAEEWLLKNEDPSLSRLKKSSYFYTKMLKLMEGYASQKLNELNK